MEKDAQTVFDQLVREAQGDLNVLAIVLTGSRGKGFDDASSDFDVRFIVKDDATETVESQYHAYNHPEIDLGVASLTEFTRYASWGSPESWDRYDFAHVKILKDTSGTISKLVQDKGSIPNDKKNEVIRYFTDAYINGVFRSVKCWKRKRILGAHLEAATSIPYLLDLLFALHGRHRPFLSYTTEELTQWPLEKLPWSIKEFCDDIQMVLSAADLKTQQKLLRGVETLLQQEGYQDALDGWDGKDRWAMELSS